MQQDQPKDARIGHHTLKQLSEDNPLLFLHLDEIMCRCPIAPVVMIINEQGRPNPQILNCNTSCPLAKLDTEQQGDTTNYFYTIHCGGSPLRRPVEIIGPGRIDRLPGILTPMRP